jgi:hypothetical protein
MRVQLDLFYVGRHSAVAALTNWTSHAVKSMHIIYNTPLPHLLFVQLDDHILIATS